MAVPKAARFRFEFAALFHFLGGNCFKSKQMDNCEYHGSLNHCLGFDPRLDYNYTESRVGSVVSS